MVGLSRRIPTFATSSQDSDALSLHHTQMEKLCDEPGRIRTFAPLLKRQVLSSILATGSFVNLERETRFELAASSLADLRSSLFELLPLGELVRRERLELSVRRLRGDCFTRLAYGARSA
jgi:hypothetical protein